MITSILSFFFWAVIITFFCMALVLFFAFYTIVKHLVALLDWMFKPQSRHYDESILIAPIRRMDPPRGPRVVQMAEWEEQRNIGRVH